MKLTDLIPYLVNTEQLNDFYSTQKLNTDSEALIIYMVNDLNIESEVSIFEIEETEDQLIFEKDGVRYIELFPIEHASQLIEFDLNLKRTGFSDIEIAKRLLEYRINDA